MNNRVRLFIDGKALREHRLRALWTQDELADKSGVSLGAIQKYESVGRVASYPRIVRKLSDALGCKPEVISYVAEKAAS